MKKDSDEERSRYFLSFRDFACILTASTDGEALTSIDLLQKGRKVDNHSEKIFLDSHHLITEEGVMNWKDNFSFPKQEESSLLITCAQQIKEYFYGERRAFTIRWRIEQGSDFQRKVWSALERIPYGVTVSYAGLAGEIVSDKKKARTYARAVGRAVGANPIPIVIPCHRVIGSNGELVGFAGGLAWKETLLNLELLPEYRK